MEKNNNLFCQRIVLLKKRISPSNQRRHERRKEAAIKKRKEMAIQSQENSLASMIEATKKKYDIMVPIVSGIIQLPEILEYGKHVSNKISLDQYWQRGQTDKRVVEDTVAKKAIVRSEDMSEGHRHALANVALNFFRPRIIFDEIDMDYDPCDL